MRWLLTTGPGFSLLLAGCVGVGGRPSGEPADPPGSPRHETAAEAETGSVDELGQLTLDGALDLAERHHRDIVAARSRVDAAEGRVQQAGLYPNPRGVLRMESAPFSGRTTGDAEYVGGLTIPLSFSGRIGAARRAAESELDRARAELESRRLKVRSAVRGSFATALYSGEVVRVQEESASQAEKQAGIVRSLHAAGESTAEDVARAEMESIRRSRELEKARRLEEEALRRLAFAVGKARARIPSVRGKLDETLEIPTLESIVLALDSQPEVLAADSSVRAQRARIDRAEARRIPEVDLDLFYRRLQETDENTFDVGISFPVPIFDRNQGRIREERALLREAEAHARLERDRLWQLAREAHAHLEAALEKQSMLEKALIPRAETVLQGTLRRYEMGDARLAEVLSARRERASLELSRLEAVAEAFAAWSHLSRWLEED